jgi:hypothetical protein
MNDAMIKRGLPLTAAVTARRLARWLRECGVQGVGATSQVGDVTDGEIDLGEGVSVQVGIGYAVVCRWLDEDTMEEEEERYDARDLIADIARARTDSKTGETR